jgi:hypothetical protein
MLAAVALGLRARAHRFVADAAAPVVAAVGTVAAVGAATVAGSAGPLAAAGIAVAAGLVLAVMAATVHRAAPGPGAGRAVELTELACLIAVVPVATLSTGALAAFREVAAGFAGRP